MHRRIALALLMAVPLVALGPAASAGENFAAPMSGGQEVPAVDTKATGVATFKLRDDGLRFKVNVANIQGIFASHIHCGAPGVNGPVGVTLFVGGPADVNGTLAEGTITAPDPGNRCGWANLDMVVAALQSGNTYVNVHTAANPPGEIRGQVK